MTILTRRDCWFLAAVFFYSFIPVFGGLLRATELAGGPSIIPMNPRAVIAPLPVILHVLGSSFFCLFGALQFVPNLRHYRSVFHKRLGVMVAISGAVSAATGLWMTLSFGFPPELQGPLLLSARVLLGLGMLLSIVQAVLRIREGNVPAHGAAMLRAYAIAQGASTQTLFGILFLVAFGENPKGLPRDILMISAWLLNLLIAQAIIRRKPPTKVSIQPTA